MGRFGAAQVIEEGLMNPIGPIVASHITDFAGRHGFEAFNDLIQGFVPGNFAEAVVFSDQG